MSETLLNINYNRHAGQTEVLSGILSANEASIFPIICSRGWGKTIFGTCDLVLPRMLRRNNTQIMWVAPTYKIAKSPIDDVWKGVCEVTGKPFIPKYADNGFQFWDLKESAMELHLFNESKIFFRSTGTPDSIVSKGYNVIIIDEAALVLKDVFLREILPTARRAGCKIYLLTTPRGKNWVYELYLAGQDLSKPMYKSFRQPWWKRPDYPKLLIELMKDVPEHLRKQEFDAEFIGDGGSLFKNLPSIFVGKEIQFPSQDQEWRYPMTAEIKDGTSFVLAVDFAKTQDFTAMILMGIEDKKVYYYSRFNKTDYKVVLERIKRLSEHYSADVIYDATGVGAGLQDFMNNISNAYPFKFTNESKNEIINRLIVACEYGQICLPNITTMREEFELFTYEITRTGKFAYSAPDGKHDDTVISVAMANFYAEENAGKSEVVEIESYLDMKNEINRPRSFIDALMNDDD